MNKTLLFSLHINSCFASSSSNDAWLNVTTKESEIDFELPTKAGKRINGSKKFPMLNGLCVDCIEGDKWFKSIYFESDKTFYNKAFSAGKGFLHKCYSDTQEFKELVQKYADMGWNIGRETPKEQKDFWDRQERAYRRKQKKEGIVLHKKYEDLTPSDYQGGFSDELFNSPGIKNYIERNAVFGWIGDSGARKAEHDRLIEAGLKERGLSYKAMSNWITSSDGRHFADSLCGKELNEQLEDIKKYLNTMFNLALIYGSENHGGMLNDTIRIREDYESKGILLPENECSYDPYAHFALMSAILLKNKELSGEKLTPNEELFQSEFFNKLKDKKA